MLYSQGGAISGQNRFFVESIEAERFGRKPYHQTEIRGLLCCLGNLSLASCLGICLAYLMDYFKQFSAYDCRMVFMYQKFLQLASVLDLFPKKVNLLQMFSAEMYCVKGGFTIQIHIG